MEGGPPTDDRRPPQEHNLAIHQVHSARSLDEETVRAAIARTVEGEGFTIQELNIVLADHAAVHDLNREWLGHDYETDVVSFILDEAAPTQRFVDGEVYVDLDTAAERADEFGATFQQEALRYVVHGLLHLMGYDDATEKERAAMRALENRYLGV